jgi:hypothetical protein
MVSPGVTFVWSHLALYGGYQNKLNHMSDLKTEDVQENDFFERVTLFSKKIWGFSHVSEGPSEKNLWRKG